MPLFAFLREWLPWQTYPAVGFATQSPELDWGDPLVSLVSDFTTVSPSLVSIHLTKYFIACLHNRSHYGSLSATPSLEI